MNKGSAYVQRPHYWLEIAWMEVFQTATFVYLFNISNISEFHQEYREPGCTFSEVSRSWNSQIYGKLSVCRWSTAEVGAIFNLNMYLWISLIHCLLFKYSCLFWLGVREIRRISGWPTWTWTVSSMRKIHRNIEDKSWFLLENKKQMPGFATCFLN